MNEITIYTDGACRGNGKAENIGAYAYLMLYGDHKKEYAKAVRNTTNNIMELTAVIEALKAIKKKLPITIYSDSQYVVSTINEGWKIKKNQKLWQDYFEIAKDFKIKVIHTRGHSGNRYNEYVDGLCNRAMDLIKEELSTHTNADRIRSMSDKELAEYIFDLGNGSEYCYGHCAYQDDCPTELDHDTCIKGVIDWLKQPVKEE